MTDDWERRVRARVDADISEYTCCITNLLMIDPVVTADGHLYEREAITTWLEHSRYMHVPRGRKTALCARF
jgi:hypothetical protein